MMQEMQSPPLKGINVLDVSRVLAGWPAPSAP
jgi:hypothetical protein